MIGDSDIDVNNVAVFFDEPHLELAVLELDTASSRRCVSENHQLLKKRQLCGVDYANKTKVLVARYRSLNRKMTQIPSVRRPDDPTDAAQQTGIWRCCQHAHLPHVRLFDIANRQSRSYCS
mmetsp:Transcript_5596/g.9431  ORF Transcript_5596/g.9431 Transcript_5596/m.9431 type:complete len:121 (+) Transcript_5596:2640-3002(+)